MAEAVRLNSIPLDQSFIDLRLSRLVNAMPSTDYPTPKDIPSPAVFKPPDFRSSVSQSEHSPRTSWPPKRTTTTSLCHRIAPAFDNDSLPQPEKLINGRSEQVTRSIDRVTPVRFVRMKTQTGTHFGRKDEYIRVCAEHKRQGTILSKSFKRIVMTISSEGGLHNKKARGKEKELKKNGNDEKNENIKSSNAAGRLISSTDESSPDNKERDQVEGLKSLSSIPTFMPLNSQGTADFCPSVCLQLLRCQLKWHSHNEDGKKKATCHPPSVTHGALLLLTRILRHMDVHLIFKAWRCRTHFDSSIQKPIPETR